MKNIDRFKEQIKEYDASHLAELIIGDWDCEQCPALPTCLDGFKWDTATCEERLVDWFNQEEQEGEQ